MSTTEYDVIVIGAGPVGENVADRTRAGGLSTLIIEAELVGGDCSYWACVPSKVLLRGASALRAAGRVDGVDAGTLDVAATLRRRDSFVSEWSDDGQVEWLRGAGIDLVRGHATIAGERRVAVDGTVYTARQAVVVATGSAALMPDIPGLADVQPWQSRDATSVKDVPARLVIVGGGVVGVEMATAFAGLGSRVTLLARTGLLGPMEPFAGELVAAGLKELGVDVRTGVSASGFERVDGVVTVQLGDAGSVEAEQVLVATGRVPRTTDLGLDSIGLNGGDWLTTDDTLRVDGFDWLYATGDVNHRALLTHQGKYQARAAGDVIVARAAAGEVQNAPWGRHVATADHEAVPQVVFSDPEVASVGLTERAARDAGYDIRVVDYDLGSVSGAGIHADGFTGRARMVVDEKRRVLLGVTFVGPDVSELLQAATVAVVGEVPLERLWHAVPAFPTINEVWLRLLETYGR
ncbi:dihydrolipoamide dehydrogenase [Homoserinimonas aerilata]|uniref:Dihydrolipoamide dehydrogenase n=1 Tax=Homoserinimonas aerilata TaxID=1162970 RepID=A0A542YEW9_9MICO|nr:NAD(P)/FAD-dependent oxidoreductase [Homoserinimonas aerilata]TQL46643.1 dihydrolipoamide dehydrogenase [Homoserinimonas aerilata]